MLINAITILSQMCSWVKIEKRFKITFDSSRFNKNKNKQLTTLNNKIFFKILI